MSVMNKLRYFTVFSLIAFGSRDTLDHSITPLIGTISDLNELKTKMMEKVKDARAVTPEEILETLDLEAFEKVKLGFHSVGVSLIICCSELIKKISDDRASTNHHFKLEPQKAYEFYKLGPQINEVPWADAVVCASNYVRHDDEWQSLISPIKKIEDGISSNISYCDIDWESQVSCFPSDPKRNVTTLKKVGIPYESFLKHQSIAGFEIAKTLGLFDKDRVLNLYDEWVTAVVANAGKLLELE